MITGTGFASLNYINRRSTVQAGVTIETRGFCMARTTRTSSRAGTKRGLKWSAEVLKRSDALDLERGVFTKGSARQIALLA
jgi:hypothetical protein